MLVVRQCPEFRRPGARRPRVRGLSAARRRQPDTEQEVVNSVAAGGLGKAPTPRATEYESLSVSSAWRALHRGVAEFLGDVFGYLPEQGAASGIGAKVCGAIR